MTAYCTANRLLSGCHLPLLCIGIEYIATNNPTEARQHFKQAYEICNRDPLVLHELGVIEFRTENYAKAEGYFRDALDLCKPSKDDYQVMGTAWEPTLSNLALTCHKQQKYDDAIQFYEEALAICPRSAATYAGIAYTHHCVALLSDTSFSKVRLQHQISSEPRFPSFFLSCLVLVSFRPAPSSICLCAAAVHDTVVALTALPPDLNTWKAIEWYHKALGLNPDDTFSAQMLQRALIEEVKQDIDVGGGGHAVRIDGEVSSTA